MSFTGCLDRVSKAALISYQLDRPMLNLKIKFLYCYIAHQANLAEARGSRHDSKDRQAVYLVQAIAKRLHLRNCIVSLECVAIVEVTYIYIYWMHTLWDGM